MGRSRGMTIYFLLSAGYNLFYGNLGNDLLRQAHKVTFDFKAMTLTLQ
jgi:hypothetical protein